MSDKLRTIAKNIKPDISNAIVNDKLILNLSGSVGKPYWFEEEEDFINEKHVKALVDDTDKDIVIKLNSPGGDVFEGIAVYNYLKSLDNHVTIEVTALAASAASIIAMAGDETLMCTGSQMMVHEASTITWGNKSDHYKAINALESVDESIMSVYAKKTNLEPETILDWLESETWFTADEAVENGLADGVVEDKLTAVNVSGEGILLDSGLSISANALNEEYIEQLINERVNEFMNKKQPKGLNKLFGGK